MRNNEILHRLADALTLTEDRLAVIFALGGETITSADARPRHRGRSGLHLRPAHQVPRRLHPGPARTPGGRGAYKTMTLEDIEKEAAQHKFEDLKSLSL